MVSYAGFMQLFVVKILFCMYAHHLTFPLQSTQLVNPKPFLSDLVGKTVRIRLKWGQEYQGKLASSDAYMNLELQETEEFIDGQFAGTLGEVLIRCNNVLYVKAADLRGTVPMED
jgi:small nuclear ribonucleoprotein F